MTGKTVSRALCGLFMVDATLNVQLVKLLLPEHDAGENSIGGECLTCDKLENADLDSIQACYDSVLENRYVANEDSTLTAVTKLDLLLQCMKMKLLQESRTAKLWIQYMHHMETLRMFIRAERSGDWNLHLISVTRMLNIFAAKPVCKMSTDVLANDVGFAGFTSMAIQTVPVPWYHTIRRSERYWSGLWTDLVIEQVLMRSLKSRGGLSHGRGLTESVRLMWIHGERAFSFAGPAAWNNLPKNLQHCSNTDVFKKKLKTFLFQSAFVTD